MAALSEFSKRSSFSSNSHHKYDVFLSFRGVDTRHSFTDHLHKSLMDANLSTFLDDEEIEAGGDLKPELASAIKASRASIIVLSKNYANSSWCLDELVLILEQHMTSNQIVIPIFYHVEPSHVRKQESTFGVAMAEHLQKMEAETNANKRSQLAQKIDRWIRALTEVADLKGKDVYGRRETQFIEDIVESLYCRLHTTLGSDLPLLIGMDYSIEYVNSWLKDGSSETGDILTILGMAGIGKTLLAKYVYGLHFREFDTSSYIENISIRCAGKFNGLLDIQKQLCDNISKPSLIQVHDVSMYTSKIENILARKKVFLVLDDIDSLDQLDALLGSKGVHLGTKIIITTKDVWLTESCALFKTHFKPKHVKHFLSGLYEIESQQLLCFHAFRCKDPKEGYEEVSKKLVKYCEGHPLALEVLGKSLHNRDVAYWEEFIEGLNKEIGSSINNVLRMSFDSLPSKNDKDLFKHIACFFVGIDRDITEIILKACHINTVSGITNLIDKCLLSIGWNNELTMHPLLQEMGRFVVSQESPDKPWKRSRLWCHQESFKVLKQKKGKGNLLGLALDMQMLDKKTLHTTFELKTNALSKMDNLMLLQLNYVQIRGSYKNFPGEIRWLCMHGFPLKSIPSDLAMQNLVALDMSYSKIDSFGIYNPRRPHNQQKLIGSLKILNLSFCQQLHTLGGFDQLPALEWLIVRNCINLVEVCESIQQCDELVFIDLSYCNKLEKLPRTIGMLNKVKTLLLDGCNLWDMNSTEIPEANSIGINTTTSSSRVLDAIPSGVKVFTFSLPRSLVSLSLENNKLSTDSFPMDFSWLSMLKALYLDGNPIASLPNCVRSLPRLEILSMQDCRMLTTVEHPPRTLKQLILYSRYKPLLRKVVFDPEISSLKLSMYLHYLAPSSFEFEGLVKIQPLASVEEKVLRSLGWTGLNFLKEYSAQFMSLFRGSEESHIQMYYEFGIFSTIYGGKEMPSWIKCRSKGSTISFTIPSSPKKLRGLNFCSVQAFRFPDHDFLYSPMIMVRNITKNRTWMYRHFISEVIVVDECMIYLSHWMFGINEMEGGDQVIIGTHEPRHLIQECGVRFVYDDGKTDEEDDVLGYYKLWNHVIGGDLLAFQITSGEYILNIMRFMRYGYKVDPYYLHFVGDGATYKEHKVCFRPLSQRKFDILGHTREDVTKLKEF